MLAIALFVAIWGLFLIWCVRALKGLTPGGAAVAWLTGIPISYGHGRLATAAFIGTLTMGLLLANLRGGDPESRRSGRQVALRWFPLLPAVALTLLWPEAYIGREWFAAALAYIGADIWATECGTRYGGALGSVSAGSALPLGVRGGVGLTELVAAILGATLPIYIIIGWPFIWGSHVPLEVKFFGGLGFAGMLVDRMLCGCFGAGHGRGSATSPVSAEHHLKQRNPDRDAVNLVVGLLVGGGGVAAYELLLRPGFLDGIL